MSAHTTDPHVDQPVLVAGSALASGQDAARGALILAHGRGGSARDILGLGQQLALDGLALLAPQAAGHTWYPYSFLAPIEANEPALSSALGVLSQLVERAESGGIDSQRIGLLGFSQGACLVAEFAARSPRRYGAVISFTGGLLGPLGEPRQAPVDGTFDGTPVLFASGDPDPHVPWRRVAESAELFEQTAAQVELRRYPGMPHTVIPEQVELARGMLRSMLEPHPK